jgi:mono/diheme cytochrome c family protein/glucose/arabinose dehydrogenase
VAANGAVNLTPMRPDRTGLILVVALSSAISGRGWQQTAEPKTDFAPWVEADFPFYSSVLDARTAGVALPKTNLSPRVIVLNLGDGLWAAFDPDLLRIAAMWRGNGVTPKALAPGSYQQPDKKTPGGQTPAPEPDGTVWVANGIYPGWQDGDRLSLTDPREPAPSPEEVGRGPIPEPMGRFTAIRIEPDRAVLEYSVAGANVSESAISTLKDGRPSIARRFQVGPARTPLLLAVGAKNDGTAIALDSATTAAGVSIDSSSANGSGANGGAVTFVKVAPHDKPIEFSVLVSGTTPSTDGAAVPPPRRTAGTRRWPQEVTTKITRSNASGPYVVDDIALPTDNPWRRNVRPGDIQFLKDGTGVVITLDGDVWLVRGLQDGSTTAQWRRFTSGLHEPLTVAIRDDEIYAFDRNGIWRLRDTDANGEADRHELFSNAFAQTADMREFPSTIRPAPNGEFVIAKGGQEATTIGKHNGSVLRISSDGRTATVLGYGFRQPNISVNPRTGLVISSDQQGQYIPTTPLHIVRDRQFYGFLSDKLPREVYPAPIAEPLVWIPHATNASAMSQVWLYGARMGPLNDALVHIGFNNPELFRVLLNDRTRRLQASVVSITRAFDFPLLNGSVNPIDGQVYLAGFQILGWGTTATRLAGLGRVRYTGAPFTGPREIIPMDTGILVRFDVPLDPASASNADNFSLTSWHYKRTFNYGSPQYKSDGSTGIDRVAPGRAYVSSDRRSVFIAVPGMKPVEQMRLAWSLTTADGHPFQDSAYFTPYELARFQPRDEGFGDLTVDLSPRAVVAERTTAVSAAEGRRIYQLYGCMACHAIDDSTVTRLGPSWKGLFGSSRPYAKGVLRTAADEAYLRESILEPAAKIVSGYERGESGMPSYAGVLDDRQIESVILFIKSLK